MKTLLDPLGAQRATSPLDGGATWRFLDSGAADGVTNMAVDAALLDHARATGECTLRVYAWSVPTLSLGRHERARRRFDAATLERAGVGVVRRPTGGRALLHHHEVTYSVTAPVHGTSLADSYHAINALLIEALARLGVSAREAEQRGAPLRPQGAPCFAEPNRGELMAAGGGKLVGSAQWRDGDALLQHGSILVENDQGRIGALTTVPSPPANAADPGASSSLLVATLTDILKRRVTYDEVRDAVAGALSARLVRDGVTSLHMVESDSGVFTTVNAHRVRFTDPEWTWRR